MDKQEEILYGIFSNSGIELSENQIKSLLELDGLFYAIGKPGFLDAIYRYCVSVRYQKEFETILEKMRKINTR